MSIIRWIHLSDIHIRSSGKDLEKYNSSVILETLWRDIRKRAILDSGLAELDFAFITGDIAWSGGANDEYDEVYSRLIIPLLEETNLDIEDIYMVPGNHDICRDAVDEESKTIQRRLTTRDRVSELFVDHTLEFNRMKILSRLDGFRRFVNVRFPHIKLDDNCNFYQTIEARHSGVKLEVLGFNSSILAQGGKQDRGKLIIGEPNVSKAFRSLGDREFTIVLVHHPFYAEDRWYKDIEKPTLIRVKANADVILSGHVHDPNVLSLSSLSGSNIQLIAGSIYENREWASNSYSYVCFDTNKSKGTVYLRRYKETGRTGPEWIRDLESTGDEKNGAVEIILTRPRTRAIKPTSPDTQSTSYQKLGDAQTNDLNRRPLLSESYPGHDSIGILFPDIYVDPFVYQRKHPSPEPMPLKDWFAANQGKEKRVLLLGNPGTGKTTSLIKVHHQIAGEFAGGGVEKKDCLIPLFFEARSHDWSSAIRLETIVESLAQSYGFNPESFTAIADGLIDSFILIDALDEAFPSVNQDFVSVDPSILSMGFPHIATCRIDFFERNLSDADFCGEYDEILVLDNWRIDREVKEFLNNYFEHVLGVSKGEADGEDIQKYLTALAAEGLPITPLSVTTFLFLWRYDRDEIKDNPIRSFAALLERFIRSWATRELLRDNVFFTDANELLNAYETVAWELHLHRDQGRLPLLQVAEAVIGREKHDPESLKDDRALLSMLRIKSDPVYHEVDVISFIHESIYEFMLAKKLIKSLRSETHVEALSYLFKHSVHQLARELLSGLSFQDKNNLVNILRDKYYSLIGGRVLTFKQRIRRFIDWLVRRERAEHKLDIHESDQIITQRGNICYFWGRLEVETKGKSLRELYKGIMSEKIKEHPMNIGTIGTGVLLTNDPEFERLYLDSVSNRGTEDIRNRTYHRVYYGDAVYQNPDTFLTDNYTHGSDDWPRTRHAILRRLESHDERAQALRGLDLVTFRRFCETRGVPCLETMQMQILQGSVEKLDSLPEEKIVIIREEYGKLAKLLWNQE